MGITTRVNIHSVHPFVWHTGELKGANGFLVLDDESNTVVIELYAHNINLAKGDEFKSFEFSNRTVTFDPKSLPSFRTLDLAASERRGVLYDYDEDEVVPSIMSVIMPAASFPNNFCWHIFISADNDNDAYGVSLALRPDVEKSTLGTCIANSAGWELIDRIEGGGVVGDAPDEDEEEEEEEEESEQHEGAEEDEKNESDDDVDEEEEKKIVAALPPRPQQSTYTSIIIQEDDEHRYDKATHFNLLMKRPHKSIGAFSASLFLNDGAVKSKCLLDLVASAIPKSCFIKKDRTRTLELQIRPSRLCRNDVAITLASAEAQQEACEMRQFIIPNPIEAQAEGEVYVQSPTDSAKVSVMHSAKASLKVPRAMFVDVSSLASVWTLTITLPIDEYEENDDARDSKHAKNKRVAPDDVKSDHGHCTEDTEFYGFDIQVEVPVELVLHKYPGQQLKIN